MSAWSRTTVASRVKTCSFLASLDRVKGTDVIRVTAVQDVREQRVHDVTFVDEPRLLHDSTRGHVVRQREGDDLPHAKCPERRRYGRLGQLGGQPLPPSLGGDRPGHLDLVELGNVGPLQPAPSHDRLGLLVVEQPEPEAIPVPVAGFLSGEVKQVLIRRSSMRPEPLGDPAVLKQPRQRRQVLGLHALAHHSRGLDALEAGRLAQRSSAVGSGSEAGSLSAARSLHRTSSGAPRSANGISIVSKSRGNTVAANTVRASSRSTAGGYRLEKWVKASIVTSASRATAAAWAAVEC